MVTRIAEPTVNTVEQARLYTRRYAKTFYFASHVLPPEKRNAAYAVYAFCRYADNIADAGEVGAEHAREAAVRLEALRRELEQVYSTDAIPGARWLALRETVRRYRIPKRYFDELLDGVAMDLTPGRCADFAQLEIYCYHVASVVGLIMCHIFGATSGEALRRAGDLGTAMQLTNILRDVGEDLTLGRVYLPRDEMQRFGITEEKLGRGIVDAPMRSFLAFQIARAREYYRRAEPGIALVPDDGSRFAVALMSTLYAGILDRIEMNGYDVFRQRAHVPLPAKIRTALRVATREGRTSGLRPEAEKVSDDEEAHRRHESVYHA